MTSDIYGTSLHQRLIIFANGGDVSGTLDAPVARKISGSHLHFSATGERDNTTEVEAQLHGDKLAGEMSVTFSNAPKEHVKHTFSGYALKRGARQPSQKCQI